jgi:hypothetical protein
MRTSAGGPFRAAPSIVLVEALDWRSGAGGLLILAGIALATLGARPANSATVDVPAA